MNAATSKVLPGDDDHWSYEVKWDGYRIVAFLKGGQVRLQTRNLLDATDDFPELHAVGPKLGGRDLILDGEVVAMDEQGHQSFSALQRRGRERPAVVYMVFDLLYLDDRSTMKLPYLERRRLLDELGVASGSAWQVPGHHVGDGAALLEATRAQGLEGLIAKRIDSTYEPGKRTRWWLKIKNRGRQEFVVGGWMPGEGGRGGRLGSLLLGYHDDQGRLRYAGRVGTGFTDDELARLEARLRPLARETPPFAPDPGLPPAVRKHGRFVEPILVAEIAFSEWTHTGTVRQGSYKGLRNDKDATEVVRET